MILSDLNFVTYTVSKNDQEYYDAERTAVGLFGITNQMVKRWGTEETYYSNLTSVPDPFNDFRFDKVKSFQFILKASKNLSIKDSDLTVFAVGLTPYIGEAAMQAALDYTSGLTDSSYDLTSKVSLLCSKLIFNVEEYLFFLVNTCKHNYYILR